MVGICQHISKAILQFLDIVIVISSQAALQRSQVIKERKLMSLAQTCSHA